jgi:hypothetical protein
MWDAFATWKEAEAAWDEEAEKMSATYPVKGLTRLPQMQGIVEETAKNLKWKSLKWILTKDHKKEVRKGFLKKPFKYAYGYLSSVFKEHSFKRDGDFFFYGIDKVSDFEDLLEQPDTLLVLGFSYCHKPFECPSGRFTDECIHDPEHPVCRQCFIGKAVNALPEKNTVSLSIPTVHYIGGKIFEIVHSHPDKKVIFMITACEMTLTMFGDLGNMVGIQGIGVRLEGRICNTMKAFELSENGIKPGLTVVTNETQQRILDLLRVRRDRKPKSLHS